MAAEVAAAGEASGELVWRLPLHDEYKDLTRGDIADLVNASAQRKAGTIYAASFLEEFVEGKPWAHLDIAGTAWDVGREYWRQGPDRLRSPACWWPWPAASPPTNPDRPAAKWLLFCRLSGSFSVHLRLDRHQGPLRTVEPRPLEAGIPRIRRMDFDLSDEQRLLRDTVRDFARSEVAPVAEELDRTKSFPYEIVEKMGELGLMGIPFPEEYGGGGADTLSYALAVEELARIDSSVGDHAWPPTPRSARCRSTSGAPTSRRASGCPSSAPGEKLAAFGLTEPEAGSDAGNTKTRAGLDDGEWVINGAKQFITNSGTDISGCVTITAVTGGDAGRRSRTSSSPTAPPATRSASPTGRWAGTPPTRARSPSTTAACPRRTCSARAARASSSSCRSSTAAGSASPRWASASPRARSTRRSPTPRSARPSASSISKFQAIQAKIADISSQIEAARLLTYQARSRRTTAGTFTLTAAQAKLITGRLAVRAAEEAVQIHGGYGYIEEYPVCRFYRDAKILTIGEGTDEVQQMVIARALGC